MNVLVVGLSYRTAPVSVLERVAVSGAAATELRSELLAQPHIEAAVVLSTCNRVEVYAAVTAFHGGLADIGSVLAERSGCSPTELARHLYVRYETEAVRHAYRVAAGLDSMVVGETQVLGQLRDAYSSARDADAVGPLLHEVMQRALRVGKRVHAETGLDRAGASVVSAGVELGVAALGGELAGRKALVLGAGSMGALAVATLAQGGAITHLANRNPERARHTAGLHGATAVAMHDVPTLLADFDLVVCATAAREPVLRVADIPAGRRLAIVDLAIPRDVDPAVGELPEVTLINLDTLAEHPGAGAAEADRLDAEAIVAAEVEAFLAWRSSASAAPTVAALRARADQVVAAELGRLRQRRPELTDAQRADIAQALHRVVQQLLHRPSVRVRELAAEPGGAHYAALLRDLFDLDQDSSYSGEFVEGGNP